MKLPHKRWGMCFCPEPCEYQKHFWAFLWYPEFSPCELDDSITEAVLIWQENFVFDTPPELSAKELQDLIQRWLETKPFFRYIPDLVCPYDKYTKVETVVLTERSAQIYFKRVCPIFLFRKLLRDLFKVDTPVSVNALLKKCKEMFKLPPWHPEETASFAEKFHGMISHLRWEPSKIKGRKVKDVFEGIISPSEFYIQQEMFFDFIKQNFPNWRHKTE